MASWISKSSSGNKIISWILKKGHYFVSLKQVGIPTCLRLLAGPQCEHTETVAGVLPVPYLGRRPALRMSLMIASQWKTLKLLCRFCISSVICRSCVQLIQQPFLAETRWQQSKKMSHQHYPCTSPGAEICNVQDCFCRVVPCSFHRRTQPKSTKISACSIDPRCILDQAMSPSRFSMYSFVLQRQQGFLPVLSK